MTEMSPAETVFFAALAKGDPVERAAYLNEACGADADLRRQVDRLLAAHPQVGSFLQDDAAVLPAPLVGERPGVRSGAIPSPTLTAIMSSPLSIKTSRMINLSPNKLPPIS